MEAEATPLGGADVFHLSTDAHLRSEGGGRNVCLLAAEVEGRIDPRRLRERVANGPPELSWRLGHGLAHRWLWRPDGPRMALAERPRAGSLLETAVALLDEPVIPSAPWRLTLLRGRDHDAIALSWFHAVTDAKGAARLLDWLGNEEPFPAHGRHAIGERLLAGLDPAVRRRLMQAYLGHSTTLGELPILSLARAQSGPRGRPAVLRVHLSRDETRAFDASLRKRAGLADTSIILWAAARLFDALLDRRGYSPPHHLVPLPLSLDPKKGSPRMFGNHLTMMLMALDRDDLAAESRAVQSLARQRRAIVRDKLDLGMIAAMSATSALPWRLIDYLARRPFGGERASFVMSNPGDLELTTFQGRPIRDAFALPIVLTAPGFQVTADRHAGRLSVMFSFRDGLVSAVEMEGHRAAFVRSLLDG